MSNIADIRKEYSLQTLDEHEASPNPIIQFEQWWKDATSSDLPEVNAMTLATASADGLPSARIVLLKGFDERGFRFYTNYESFKGKQLLENPRACLVFFWKELERQVRVTGLVEKTDEKDSNDYYVTRPRGSRIGAWASPQSEIIENSQWLTERWGQFEQKFAETEIPRPPQWGGYLVRPVTIEFWQGRRNRLHDRLQYSLEDNGSWIIERLAP